MNRHSLIAKLLVVLCLLALTVVQVFGAVRGYVCDCSGALEWTMQDHCHGPHDAGCHREDRSDDGSADHCGDGDRQDHEQVRDDLQTRLLPTLEAPAHVPVLVAMHDGGTISSAAKALPARMAVAEESVGPPAGVLVARTIVLLI